MNGKTGSKTELRDFLEAATEKRTVMTSIKVALVVGTILALINYGDRIFLSKDCLRPGREGCLRSDSRQ